jgi:CRISPR-associated endonuclease/helicase Cas3
MCSSYKNFSEIIENNALIEDFLSDAHLYHAHTPAPGAQHQAPETLAQHANLVQGYFLRLVKSNHLDAVVDRLIEGLLNENAIEDQQVANYIKLLFVNAIYYHDFGKINGRFQIEKMHNPNFMDAGKAQLKDSKHSALGACIYLAKHLDEINSTFDPEARGLLMSTCLMLSYPIFKHHAKSLDNNDVKQYIHDAAASLAADLKIYLDQYHFEVHPRILDVLQQLNKYIFEQDFSIHCFNNFELYNLVKLNYSLLTSSDYLASDAYVSQKPSTDFGLLNYQRIQAIDQHVRTALFLDQRNTKINHNKNVYDALESHVLQNPSLSNGQNLNILRQEMAIALLRNLQKNLDKNLFYIEAPTGGGKTNLSMLACLELLKHGQGNINKVYYIFPFTSLITQTYQSIIETFGLKEDEVVELHSKAEFKQKTNEDDIYGAEKQYYIDHLFVNFPFCLMSHIKFFDVLKSSNKGDNYLLQRLANSVVIIDELQSYNPEHWDKIIYFITQYAKFYNIKFVLMSATLPKIDQLNHHHSAQAFVNLLPNAKADYFENPNFAQRVGFNFDLLGQEIELADLKQQVLEKSKAHALIDGGKYKPKDSVYTIVEFIYKKTATAFYKMAQLNNDFFDEILLLSGSILEHRRQEIIAKLKSPENRKKRLLLISTQVVEAGVDIDMDLGFKNRSLIDSDEQLAGRINRNVNKTQAMLYLFDYDKPERIYGQDKRFELGKKIGLDEHRDILVRKDFDTLYQLVLQNINQKNKREMMQGFADYLLDIQNLRFQQVHQNFKLINQKTISCFVPIELPISIDLGLGNTGQVFSNHELAFLASHGVEPKNEHINGEVIFDLYLSMIKQKQDFISQKVMHKRLQSLMSKYTFSVIDGRKKDEILHFADLEKSEYGYLYLRKDSLGEDEDEAFYSLKSGLDDEFLLGNEKQFL